MAKGKPFDFMGEVKKTKEAESSSFLFGLTQDDFIETNKVYLMNYINADISIALSHIKNSYKKYVLEGGWSQDKYETVLEEIISKRWMLSSSSFMKLGVRFDEGKLHRKIKTPTSSLTDEEMLRILRKNY